MFFNSPTGADEQGSMREALSYVAPKNADDVRMVAAALKTHGAKFEDLFLEWSQPFGRYKAKGLWAKVRPDPDALVEVAERQASTATHRSRFRLQSPVELDPNPMPYRIKAVAPAQGLMVVYGASGSGKSFLCIDAAAAIAEGSPFFGYATKPAPVLYVGLEGEAGVQGRVTAWEQHHGRSMPADIRFLLQPFRLTDPQDVADLGRVCPPGSVVFIDTLNRAAPGLDENSSKDMGAVIEGAKTLQRLTAGLVILVAHSGKDATKGLRGHSSLFAALDGAILVSREGDARRWKVDKAKDGQDGVEHRFRLTTVKIGRDADGDDLTSCIIEPDETKPTSNGRPLTDNQKRGLATFQQAAGVAGILDETGNFAGLHLSAWRDAFYRESTADNDEAKKKAFQRVRRDLVDLGQLSVADDVYRLAGSGAVVGEAILSGILGRSRDTGTGPGHSGDMSRVASLPPGGQDGTPPYRGVPCPGEREGRGVDE